MTTLQLDYSYNHQDRGWPRTPATAKLLELFDSNLVPYLDTLGRLGSLDNYFAELQSEGDVSKHTPFWNNIWLPPLDAVALAGLVALNQPRTYVEVGSGNSTKFVRWVVKRLGLATRIVSIDPAPRAEIDKICDVVMRAPLESVDQRVFSDLLPNDIVFIDNSHRSFPSSDVTVFFVEVLPNLPKGVVFGLHDIFLPFDYPLQWSDRFYNEQYLLAAYLYGGAARDEHVFAAHYLSRMHPERLQQAFPILTSKNVALTGGAFFMKRPL